MMLCAFHDKSFIFGNSSEFSERVEEDSYFGAGTILPVRPGRHMWETNFVPNLSSFDKLRKRNGRGGGRANVRFIPTDRTMHAHMSGR
jgi:hypothetical protein